MKTVAAPVSEEEAAKAEAIGPIADFHAMIASVTESTGLPAQEIYVLAAVGVVSLVFFTVTGFSGGRRRRRNADYDDFNASD
ncbi:MAG: hypothetical protein AAF360_07855 [Pseudomonadota bacterium]